MLGWGGGEGGGGKGQCLVELKSIRSGGRVMDAIRSR